jgi:cellulose synthase/poly-beta-1,6-N-acetylglucosamine synthase-like glycosyltransferase
VAKLAGGFEPRLFHLDKNSGISVLDAHFTLEQVGRNSQSHFINFNGTAEFERKECIIDAGNWESDTITEDLDLSHRAQPKKWKQTLEHVVTQPS